MPILDGLTSKPQLIGILESLRPFDCLLTLSLLAVGIVEVHREYEDNANDENMGPNGHPNCGWVTRSLGLSDDEASSNTSLTTTC